MIKNVQINSGTKTKCDEKAAVLNLSAGTVSTPYQVPKREQGAAGAEVFAKSRWKGGNTKRRLFLFAMGTVIGSERIESKRC